MGESGHRHLGAAAIHGRDGVANELKRARRTGKQRRINLAVLDLLSNAPMNGTEVRSTEVSAPLAGWTYLLPKLPPRFTA